MSSSFSMNFGSLDSLNDLTRCGLSPWERQTRATAMAFVCAGRLLCMIHVPGDLFSVNPSTVRGISGLFTRNERMICVFESASGPFVITLVGGTIVGSIATVWYDAVTPPRPGAASAWVSPWPTDGRPLRAARHSVNEQGGAHGLRFGRTRLQTEPRGPDRRAASG